jgi:hypothetical protein
MVRVNASLKSNSSSYYHKMIVPCQTRDDILTGFYWKLLRDNTSMFACDTLSLRRTRRLAYPSAIHETIHISGLRPFKYRGERFSQRCSLYNLYTASHAVFSQIISLPWAPQKPNLVSHLPRDGCDDQILTTTPRLGQKCAECSPASPNHPRAREQGE